jgi:hypothetical protein
MTKDQFEEFVGRYNRLQTEGYDYEEMAHFLMYNIDDLIEIADRYFDNH